MAAGPGLKMLLYGWDFVPEKVSDSVPKNGVQQTANWLILFKVRGLPLNYARDPDAET
ncbi:hypothetical protein [Camelimonas lactis]|uniref:Uncharacterized protein n=1 Tax=Camelimonas lactis TaxID=659006 RepID=A0A4R2GJ47_9HYPH|nr:hypothetical protein [Camelimonas lactis]TCO07347.1 hypothetical protein EV666_13510 [Camelimonas lactis]